LARSTIADSDAARVCPSVVCIKYQRRAAPAAQHHRHTHNPTPKLFYKEYYYCELN